MQKIWEDEIITIRLGRKEWNDVERMAKNKNLAIDKVISLFTQRALEEYSGSPNLINRINWMWTKKELESVNG
jgi:hypothetical protein